MSWDGKVMFLGALMVAAGLAGCLGGQEDGGGATPPGCQDCPDDELNATSVADDPTGPRIVNASTEASIQGAGSQGTYVCNPNQCDNSHVFDLGANATGLLLEAIWDGGGTLHLTADIPREHCTEQAAGVLLQCPDPDPVTGQSPLRLEITDAETLAYTGEWQVRVWVDSATPDSAEPVLWSSVVYQAPMPDGLTHAQP